MEVAMPVSGAAAIDCYEDMFKEITRKLYGEDGLPEISNGSGGDRPTTSSQSAPLEYDVDNPVLKPEEHLTAFGLAALMQNGFPLNAGFHQDKWSSSEETLHWTQSKIASYNPAQKVYRCAECDCVGHLSKVAEHWLGTHSNLRAFQCPQCPYESAWAKCVRMHLSRQHNINTDENSDTLQKNNPVLQEISKYLQKLKFKLESGKVQGLEEFHANSTSQTGGHTSTSEGSSTKRYTCTYCPYATDRRDLFTRHENIHREEKPFQCYVCQKQFNRADHVKKHFLRMHREHPYDLNRIRRHPPKNASGMSYYQKYNSNSDPIPTVSNINSLSIPNGFNTNRTTQNVRPGSSNDVKNVIPIKPGVVSKSSGKKKGEKRFSCCYCSWSGVDNWCLKRHMNTHLKPFVCGLCDYKAARSERLATHVLKVHNKRACGKCSFLADDPTQLSVHQQEHHPLEQRNRAGNILRNTSFNSGPSATASCSQSSTTLKAHELSAAAALLQHSNRLLQGDSSKWKQVQRQHGAARLFNYMEASDGSEPESEPHGTNQSRAEDMSRMNLNHRIQSDFPEAGDAASQGDEEEGTEEPELPLFVCPTCGCEFEDDASLETHQHTHAHRRTAASPAKENINPKLKYRCRLCDCAFESQPAVMAHMAAHSSLAGGGVPPAPSACKRPRKQSRPKKMVPLAEAQQTIARRALCCVLCKSSAGNRYHSKGSLALHQYWKHLNKRFKCEHCDLRFRHQYQCVLHASRAHLGRPQPPRPHPVPTKEPGLHEGGHHHLFANAHSQADAHKLGMAFFDHSFVHPGNTVNGHMPIIIPTFPPN